MKFKYGDRVRVTNPEFYSSIINAKVTRYYPARKGVFFSEPNGYAVDVDGKEFRFNEENLELMIYKFGAANDISK